MNAEVFSYNGVNITFELGSNIMINLTEVAKAFPKKNLSKIVNSKEINEYVKTLSEITKVSSLDLLIVRRGGDLGNEDQGTWAHQKVALRVAQKLSVEFAIWVDTKIEQLLTKGTVSIQKPLTPAELLLQNAQLLVDHENRIMSIEKTVGEINARTLTMPDYYTIAGYSTLKGIDISLNKAAGLGRIASKICKDRNIQTDTIPDPRFGIVKLYPSHILDEIFEI